VRKLQAEFREEVVPKILTQARRKCCPLVRQRRAAKGSADRVLFFKASFPRSLVSCFYLFSSLCRGSLQDNLLPRTHGARSFLDSSVSASANGRYFYEGVHARRQLSTLAAALVLVASASPWVVRDLILGSVHRLDITRLGAPCRDRVQKRSAGINTVQGPSRQSRAASRRPETRWTAFFLI